MVASGDETWLPTQDAYDLWADTYDADPNGLVVLERRFAMPWLDPQAGERILDAGCGTGDHLVELSARGAHPVGVDFSFQMLQAARAKSPSVPVVAADLSNRLPFGAVSFDGVLCSLVSEHLADLDSFFSEIHRVLRPGGRLVFSGLHPDRVTGGLTAGFAVADRRYRTDAAAHRLADYLEAAARSRLDVTQVDEARVDDALVAAVPRVGRFLGENLLFVLSVRRPA